MNISGVEVEIVGGEVRYEAGAAIDCDGAPNAYALPSSGLVGLDNIRNALRDVNDDPENPAHGWAGVVVNAAGQPVAQIGGPYAGYLVSPTALYDQNFPTYDPRRYVDATEIPYISIPPQLESLGVCLGDGALVADRDTGLSVQCLVADIGPRKRLGEVSVACAKALGFPDCSPRHGGVDRGVIVRIFIGSHQVPPWKWGRTAADVAVLVDAWASQS